MALNLRFPLEEIPHWSARYDDDVAPLEAEVIPFMREERYLTKPLFLKLARWKSPRIIPRCETNAEDFVEEVTRTALATQNEQLRIEVLTLLCGVGWPVASVILHFGYENQYPVLDFRALWSLGVEVPEGYTFPFWRAYTEYARHLASKAGVTMREIDRALWQYSKEMQREA